MNESSVSKHVSIGNVIMNELKSLFIVRIRPYKIGRCVFIERNIYFTLNKEQNTYIHVQLFTKD